MSSTTTTADARPSEEKTPLMTVLKRFGKEFADDDIPGLAAEVAYHAVFAIPAIMILLVLIGAIFEQTTDVAVADRLRELVDERAPADTKQILSDLIDNAIAQTSGGLASIGALSAAVIALWSGSNATATLMKAFNRAYDIDEDRPFIKKKAVAIGLTALLGLMINLAFVLFVFGGKIGQWVADRFGLGNAFELAVNIGRWPLGVLFLMLMLAVLYYLGPNVEQSFRWISPGSVAATVLWIGLVLGFSIYLQFSNPGSAYGTLSSILVFLFFLYLTAIVLLIGAELNAVVEKRYDPATVKDIQRKQAAGEAEPDALHTGEDGPPPAEREVQDRRPAPVRGAAPAWHSERAAGGHAADGSSSWGTVAKAGAATAGVILLSRFIRR